MNSFGRVFRVSIFGESHGQAVGILVDGCPAGLDMEKISFGKELAERIGGKVGTTSRVEKDEPDFVSGVFKGKSTGAPILILFPNKDIDSSEYEKIKNTPRPGHSDHSAFLKFGGFNDYRGGGHFSGRLTAGLVGAGAIAKALIKPVNIKARVMEVAGSKDIERAIEKAKKEGDSLGGLISCHISKVPSGLGEPFFDSVESLLSHIVFAIPGIKAIEFGAGFKSAKMTGSRFNDPILNKSGTTLTNNSGGINGGITNSNDILFTVAARPPAGISKEQQTIDLVSGTKKEISIKGRHDICFALRLPVILESVSAIVLADLMMLENRIE